MAVVVARSVVGSKLPRLLVTFALLALPQAALASLSEVEKSAFRSAVQAYTSTQIPAANAQRLGAEVRDRNARLVLQWLHLQEDTATDTRFTEYAAFLSQHPDWPRRVLIALQAERRLTGTEDAELVRRHFTTYPPQTLAGLNAYVKTLDDPTEAIRSFWRTATLSNTQQAQFLQRYRSQLDESSLHQRVDQLLLGRLMPEGTERRTLADGVPLGTDHKMGNTARSAMIAQMAGKNRGKITAAQRSEIETLVKKVPADVQADTGFVYDYARWLEFTDQPERAARVLLSQPRQPHGDVGYNFGTRDMVARELVERGQVELAYRVASEHGITAAQDGNAFRDSEWLSGWIALRFLGKPEKAAPHFQQMFEASKAIISKARGAYWLARTAQAQGQGEDAEQWYAAAARFGPTTYYGQLAALERYPDQNIRVIVPTLAEVDEEVRERFDRLSLVKAAKIVRAAGLRETFRTLSTAIAERVENQSRATLALQLAADSNWPEAAAWAARRIGVQGFIVGREGYPILREVPDQPEAAVIHAIIRQESTFEASARSPVGAVGLMQLMPGTAKAVAARLKLPYTPQKLDDPAYNARLGSAYLNQRINELDGSYVLAFAAYNAGISRPRQWLERFGPLHSPRLPFTNRSDTALWRAIDWIETIPFPETRNYVIRVSEAIGPYRAILAGERKTILKLDEDILR